LLKRKGATKLWIGVLFEDGIPDGICMKSKKTTNWTTSSGQHSPGHQNKVKHFLSKLQSVQLVIQYFTALHVV
jgi:hypothetical protein